MATPKPTQPPFTTGPAFSPAVPSPFEFAARRFEKSGADLYLHDPVGFARDCIRWAVPAGSSEPTGLTVYQCEVLDELIARRRVAVRGPHGLGKTTTFAMVILWFAITREAARIDWKIPTTAGSWGQLRNYLWPEVHKWAARVDWGRLETDPWRPDRELLTMEIKGRNGVAFASSPSDPQLIEGAHADHLLFVFDESKSIPPSIFDAAEGALSGDQPEVPGGREAYALTQSTPGEPQGRFYDIHMQKPGLTDWSVRHVTKREVINAGRMSPVWAENRKLQWGFDSFVYQNRVEGEFWVADEDAVIPLSWVEAANERWVEWNRSGEPSVPGHRVFGVDVARGGADRTIIALRQGSIIQSYRAYNLRDTTKIAHRLQKRMFNQTDLAVVDVIGVGAGVVDYGRTLSLTITAFNAARRTKRRDRSGLFGFKNQRAAMWWVMREALDPAFDPTLAIPPDDDLTGELVAPKWRIQGDKIVVESKDEVRKRIGRSTDIADACLQTLLTDAEFNSEPDAEPSKPFPYTDRADPDDGPIPWN